MVDIKLDMLRSPLFVGGAPRSGTTALLQVLNSNANAYVSSEENLLSLIKVFGKSLGTRERRASTLAGGMRELSERETLTADNIHSHNFTEKSLWPSIRYLYKWHHKQSNAGEPLILWGDKLPNYYKELDAVLAVPQVKYLHITRNPYDVVNSMLRRTEMSKQGKDWWRAITDVENMIEAWASAYKAMRKVESATNTLHVQYESLVFEFDKTIAQINAFIGVELAYQNVMVDDLAKHYDRSYITDEVQQLISSNVHVMHYVKRFSSNADYPSVAASLGMIKR